MNLTTDTDLAARFGLPLERFHEMRRRKGWPCVRFGRFDIRFTDEQIAQIIHVQSESKPKPAPVEVDGQTSRSKAARKAS